MGQLLGVLKIMKYKDVVHKYILENEKCFHCKSPLLSTGVFNWDSSVVTHICELLHPTKIEFYSGTSNECINASTSFYKMMNGNMVYQHHKLYITYDILKEQYRKNGECWKCGNQGTLMANKGDFCTYCDKCFCVIFWKSNGKKKVSITVL